MIEAMAGKMLGILIGFALGAAYMAWMGSDPARSLFFRKPKPKPRPGVLFEKSKMKDRGGGHYSRPVDFDPQKLSCTVPIPEHGKEMKQAKLNKNFATGVPDCPMCHGRGSVPSLSAPSGASEIPCSCWLPRDISEDDTVKLTLEQSQEVAALVRGESPVAYVTVHVEDIIRPKIKAMMQEKSVRSIKVEAQIAANLTGKTFKTPEALAQAVFHEEGDLHLRDEFGHLLEGRGPVTIKTYGPKTGRLSCSKSNFNPREDEITEHSLDHEHVDEFGGVDMGPDEPGGEDEIERRRRHN